MTTPDNTSAADYLELNTLGMLAVGSSDWILGQERDGQRQLVNSTSLPANTYGTDAEFLALGFQLGEPNPSDPLFRSATLPDGWTKQASDHSMWSYIVDELGRRRVSVFYKAAFYDRDAFMRLQTVHSYAYGLRDAGELPVYDDVWCTREVFAAEVAELRTRRVEYADQAATLAAEGADNDYWPRRAIETRAELAVHDAWAARVGAAR